MKQHTHEAPNSPAATSGLRRAARVAIAAVAGGGLPLTSAVAFDTGPDSSLNTQTIANAEWQKKYDDAGVWGAATVAGHDRGLGLPEGLRYGNFYISPEINASTAYDSNIFRSATGQVSDIRIEVIPVVTVTSDLPRHAINFGIAGRLMSFVQNDDQNYQDVGANFSGALHIDHAHTLAVSMLSGLEHLERGLTFTPSDAKRPVPVFHNRAAAGLTRDAGRLYGTFSVSAERWDFEDVDNNYNETLDQDYRDSDLFTAQLLTGYRISPGFALVGKFKALRQLNIGDETSNSQSTGYEATAGLQFQTSPLLRWHLLGGWEVRDFDNVDTANIQSSLIEGGVDWLAMERLTVRGAVSRSISADSTDYDTGSIETSINGSLDYDIFHNLVAHAGFSVSDVDFTSSDRKDTTYAATVGLDYYFSKNAKLTLGYQHETRDSTIPTDEMTRDVVSIGAKWKF